MDQPTCHKCRKAESVSDLVWCSATGCDHYVCEDCTTETLWELEACSDACGQIVASSLARTIRNLRSEAARAALENTRKAA